MSQEVVHELAELARAGPCTAPELVQGPTPNSNWIIPNRLLVGSAPLGAKLEVMRDAGVTVFADLRSANTAVAPHGDVVWENFPLADRLSGFLTDINDTRQFLSRVLDYVFVHDAVVYLFCEDGIAVSAIATVGILSMLYTTSALKSMNITAQQVACRGTSSDPGQLFSSAHKAFCKELCDKVRYVPHGTPSPGNKKVPPMTALLPRLPSSEPASTASTPHRGSRFEHSRGHGGGFTSINIFGESTASTPDRRHSARKFVEGHTPGCGDLSPQNTPNRGGRNSHQLTPLQSAGTSPTQRVPPPQMTAPPSHHSPQLQQSHTAAVSIQLERASVREEWGLELEDLVIVDVVPNTAADRAQVPLGVIAAVDGEVVETDDELAAMITARMTVTLTIVPTEDTRPAPPPRREPPAVLLPRNSPSSGSGQTHGQRSSIDVQSLVPFSLPDPLNPQLLDANLIEGPTPTSNWVIGRQVLCGAAPRANQRKDFKAICDTGIHTFVSLLEEGTAPYADAVEKVLGRPINILHYAIRDGTIPSNISSFLTFLGSLAHLVQAGERIYIHCSEGHGRTGIVIAALLAHLYDMRPMKALNLCSALHACRSNTGGQDSPQTQEQRLFVLSLDQ